jgi:uridine kinase
MIDALAHLVAAPQVTRVAIDGPDAAGKTTLAGRLARALAGVRPVVQAGIDGFHQPREVRHRRGSLSPEGYYWDSFDYAAVRAQVLEPFEHAEPGAVLLFEGVFLLRPELRDHWDLSVFVDVSPAESLRRALTRDLELFGDEATVRERYEKRYFPGQRLYRAAASPETAADVVIDNDDPARPRVLKWPGAAKLN